MDCSLPSSSVHGIFQARVLEWGAITFSLLELIPKKKKKKERDVLFIIGDWNARVGSQKIPGVTGKSGPGLQNEAGQRLTEFYQDITNTLFEQHKG